MNNASQTTHISRLLNLPWMVSVSVFVGLGALVGVLLPQLLPVQYEVSLTLDVQQRRDISDQYYSYDGFYAIQAGELMSDNVARWFMSPGFVEQVIRLSEPERQEQLSLRDLRKIFQAEQLSASLVEVQFAVGDRERGQVRAEAIEEVIQTRITEQNLEGYIIQTSPAVIRTKTYVTPFWLVGGAALGGAIALGGLLLTRDKQ